MMVKLQEEEPGSYDSSATGLLVGGGACRKPVGPSEYAAEVIERITYGSE